MKHGGDGMTVIFDEVDGVMTGMTVMDGVDVMIVVGTGQRTTAVLFWKRAS